MSEEVMVVRQSALNKVGLLNGITFDVKPYIEAIFDPNNNLFKPRDEVEIDSSYKQIIPYVIIECHGALFSYVRGSSGGEDRLYNYRSIGIGGHINKEDALDKFFFHGLGGTYNNPVDIYSEGLIRELDEEVKINTEVLTRYRSYPSCALEPIAIIVDPHDFVSSVHLGIVHLVRINKPRVEPLTESVCKTQFTSLAYLYESIKSLELWSQICIKNILEIVTKGSENA